MPSTNMQRCGKENKYMSNTNFMKFLFATASLNGRPVGGESVQAYGGSAEGMTCGMTPFLPNSHPLQNVILSPYGRRIYPKESS